MDADGFCKSHGVFGKKAALLSYIMSEECVMHSKRELAEMFGISEMTVFRYTREFESLGWVSIEGYGGQAKTYRRIVERDTVDTVDLQTRISELEAEIAELKDHIKTITDHNTTITDSLARDNFIIIKGNKPKSSTTNKETDRTKTKGAAEDHITENEPKTNAEVVFDELWGNIDWVQRARYKQTRDVQWKYSKRILNEILKHVDSVSLLDRIWEIAGGNGENLILGKTISYWLKDNKDILMAPEPKKMTWSKLLGRGLAVAGC